MAEILTDVNRDVVNFRDWLLYTDNPILDPDRTHHVFADGRHGRFFNFYNLLKTNDLASGYPTLFKYDDFRMIYASHIANQYPDELPDVFIGVGNEGNVLAKDLAAMFPSNVRSLTTYLIPPDEEEKQGVERTKVPDTELRFDSRSQNIIEEDPIRFVLLVGFIGEKGLQAATLAEQLIGREGVRRIEAVNFWQRSPELAYLKNNLEISYTSVIERELPVMSEEDCQNNPKGLCYNGSTAIPNKEERLRRIFNQHLGPRLIEQQED